jgi:membrane associated rhomboid family serine protease
MIPIRDSVGARGKAIVTIGLILFSIACFLMELKLQIDGDLDEFLQTWGITPNRISTMTSEVLAGAWLALPFVIISLLIGIFLHSSFAQILGNLLYLWVFGSTLEKVLGYGRLVVLYLVGGIVTHVIQVLVNPNGNELLMGSNGAIATILGVYLIHFFKAKIESILPLVVIFIPLQLPALSYLFWWLVQQIAYPIGSLNLPSDVNPSYSGLWADGTGFLLGAVLGYWFKRGKPASLI